MKASILCGVFGVPPEPKPDGRVTHIPAEVLVSSCAVKEQAIKDANFYGYSLHKEEMVTMEGVRNFVYPIICDIGDILLYFKLKK